MKLGTLAWRPVNLEHVGPRREKTCLWGLRQSETKTSLHSYRDQLENRNFVCIKLRYGAFQTAKTKVLNRLCG